MIGGIQRARSTLNFLVSEDYTIFFFTKHPVTNALIAKNRKFCHTGMFENAGIHVHRGKDIHECAIPDQESEDYTSLYVFTNTIDDGAKPEAH